MTQRPVTAERLRDYCEWHVQNGRGKEVVVLDRRGLSFLEPKHFDSVTIGLPPDDEMHGGGKVFVRAVF